PKPCDYFDLIGGTSTGGIIAVLLGRLQLDVRKCIKIYTKLADQFSSATVLQLGSGQLARLATTGGVPVGDFGARLGHAPDANFPLENEFNGYCTNKFVQMSQTHCISVVQQPWSSI
ncbi:hypothetical protein EJ06DRAFT_476365, partial [Trichodelitschia bisporula]